MRLVIGGSFQGKLEFVQKMWKEEHMSEEGKSSGVQAQACASGEGAYPAVADGSLCGEEALYERPIIHHLHQYIRRCLQEGRDWEAVLERLQDRNPDVWVITDEVGCGVVPMDSFEREWREAAGRAACWAARQSAQVYRVVCGIAYLLKDEEQKDA